MTIYVGQDITVTLTAQNPDGSALDPNGVIFRLKPPDGSEATNYELGTDDEVQALGDGVYTFTFDAAQAGRYNVRAETLNDLDEVVGVTEFAFLVARSRVV